MNRKLAVWILTLLCATALLVLGLVGWIGSERALNPHYYKYKWSLDTFPDLHPQRIKIHSKTGVNLTGRFFAGDGKATVLLASGYGDTEDQMLPFAEFLHHGGYNVLTYNMRSRGGSEGQYVTLGLLEQADMISVVDYLSTRPDVDAGHIGALGISMGGAIAILAAAKDRRIKGVVDDCGFSDAPGVIAASFEHFIHLPAFPFAPVTVWIADVRAGIDVNTVRPMDVIGKISPRPVLIIHGLDDAVVPAENSERNFAHARQPKELWLVPHARHGNAHTIAKAAYEKRVLQFFGKNLNR